MLSTKLNQKIISVIMIFATLITIAITFSTETNASSQKYKWRAQYNLVQGSNNTEHCYVKIYYNTDNDNGEEGSFIIEGDSEVFDENQEGYYYWISDNSVPVPSSGKRTTVNDNLPDNAIPTKLEIYVCCESSSPGYNDFIMNDIKLEVINQQGDIIGTSDIGSIYIPSGKNKHSVCTTVSISKDTNNSGPQFPEGYDFKEDRWSFSNINEKIDRQYFIDMYEEQKGQEIYEWMEKGKKHGHCFGMATSTAATLINAPYVTDYISWTGLPYTKLSSVNKGTMNIAMDISAKDYIKYCHIYQGSSSVLSQRSMSSHQGIKNVYNAVKNAALTNTDCTLIVIDLWGEPGGHTVYAAGIDGNDILVNDSNVRGELQRIKINGDSWTYSAAGLHWDSSVDATINYVDDVITPYMNLVWNVPVEGRVVNFGLETNMNYSEDNEIDGTISYYSNYLKPIDVDKLLVVSERDSFSFDESENMYKVVFTDGVVTENSNALYWIESGDTINAENISDESATLKLVGNEMKITAEMPVDSSAEMTVNENGTNKAIFDVKDDDNFSIAFTTLDDSKQFVETTLTGTSNGGKVTATETEDGIQVTGLNDITVTYETADGTAETTAKVDDGSTVNITVNDDENTVETDWQCKHPDNNHDGICDSCSEDFTKGCSCSCHSNAFMQFIHKILCFLYRIFGIEQYRYCGCGKAHW